METKVRLSSPKQKTAEWIGRFARFGYAVGQCEVLAKY